MKKLLTYCLWGNNPTYNVGAYRNAEQAQTFFPDWICRYYVGSNTPENTINTLKEYPNTEVIEMGIEGTPTAMLWRFESIDDPDVEIMMPRDTDCRFSHREVEAVKDWMASGKGFHIMRDHPYHATAMMGGMWGMRTDVMDVPMKTLVKRYLEDPETKDEKGMDQLFLARYVWPTAERDNLTHDPFFSSKDFPTKDRTPGEMVYFVGECVNADDGLWSKHDRDVLDRAEGRVSDH